jgi:predicted nucleic acid-binding protein
MRVIVDTCVWSVALRRSKPNDSPSTQTLRNLISDHLVEIIGPIRQELLSGIRDDLQFIKLKNILSPFPDIEIETEDYIMAAGFNNSCRVKGIQGSNTDFLICAVAVNRNFSIFTTDKDFSLYAKYIPIELYNSR